MPKALATHDRGAGRHPLKQREIAAHLATEIRSGRLRPGDRLPVREELKGQFSTTSTTIQRAFDQLVEEGILVSQPRQGTFVAPQPPCLDHIGVVFHQTRGQPGWRGIDETLFQLCHTPNAIPGFQFVVYESVGDSEDTLFRREQLADDLVLGRLAGVVFASNPFYLGKSFFTDLPNYPYIAIQARSNKSTLPTLSLYDDDVLTPSLIALRARGVQRLAVLVSTSVLPPVFEKILRVANEVGFTVEPQWLQAASLKAPNWAANAVQLLLSLPGTQRPEAIFVQDDTLLPFVLTGIEASPVSLDRDVQILAMCNFPTEIPSHHNILRCGPDMLRGLTMMVKHLTNQRLDRRQPRVIALPPRCEWDSATSE